MMRILSTEEVSDGRTLIRLMDDRRINVIGALWHYFSEINEWRLLLVTPLVDEIGIDKTQTKLQPILSKMKNDRNNSIEKIIILSPIDELFQSLKSIIYTGPGIHDIILQNAYIYRII